MRYFLVWILISPMVLTVRSQNNHPLIDSLRKEAKSEILDLRLAAQLELSKAYFARNLDSSYHFAAVAYDAVKNRSDSLAMKIKRNYTVLLTETKELDPALPILEELISYYDQKGDKKELSAVYNTLGNYHFYAVNNEMALEAYRAGLELEQELDNPVAYAKSLANFGIMLGRMGRFEECKNAYLEAYTIFKKNGEKRGMLQQSVNLCSEYGYNNRSHYSLDSAIYYGRHAVEIAREMNFEFGIAKASGILASSLIRKGYEDPKYLQEGLEASLAARTFFASSPSFVGDYQTAYLNEGYAYEALGQTDKAIAIANELLSQNFFADYEVYRLLYRSYKRAGDYKKALEAHERNAAMLDSLHNLNMVTRINELQTKYETEKKDRAIENLSQQTQIQELELKQRNTLLIIGAIIFLLIIVVIAIWNRIRSIRNEQFVASLEQRMLRLQMNPHFIFNALASIQNYILQSNTKESVMYLAKFGKLMRQILEHSREEFISISEEADMLQNYLIIQQLRFKNRFEFEIEIDPSIDIENMRIPPLFAQPFVENAIEHGLEEKSEGGFIKIRFEKKDQVVQLVIEDNGKGIEYPAETATSHKSLATIISRERLDILKKDFGNKLSLKVEKMTHQSGTKATLILPMLHS